MKRNEYNGDPNELLTINIVSKLIHRSFKAVRRQTDLWIETRGQLGLRFISTGTQRLIRRKSLEDWLTAEEQRMICAV